LPNQKIVEKQGNPLIVSAIVVYHIEDAKKAILGALLCWRGTLVGLGWNDVKVVD